MVGQLVHLKPAVGGRALCRVDVFLRNPLAFESVLLKDLDGVCHFPYFVFARHTGDFNREFPRCQPPHGLRDRPDRPSNPTLNDPKSCNADEKSEHEQ